MSFVKCPQCSQSVLSVASRCTRCFAELKVPGETGLRGEMTECRKCRQGMLARMSACPHCGIRQPATPARGLMVALVAALALVGFAITAVLRQPSRTTPSSLPAAPGQPAGVAPASRQAPLELSTIARPLRVRPVTEADRADSNAHRSREQVDSAIARARQALGAAVQPAGKPDSASSRRLAAASDRVSTRSKWVTRWANLRGAPNGDSEVVQVLRPGQQIAVAGGSGGWWLVLENGRQLGYVAKDLVGDRPASQ